MGDEQLISFIQKSRGKGRSDEQIARALLTVGWKKERVDEAFASLAPKKPVSGKEQQSAQGSAEQGGTPTAVSLPSGQKPPPASPLQSPPMQPPKTQPAPPPAAIAKPPSSPAAMKPLPAGQTTQPQPQEPPQPSANAPPPSQKSPWPSEQSGVQGDLLAPIYPSVSDEKQVKNPAFSNLGRASAGSLLRKYLPFIIVGVLILAAGAYYFLFMANNPPKESIPAQPPAAPSVPIQLENNTTAGNATQPQPPSENITQNQTVPPSQPPAEEQPPEETAPPSEPPPSLPPITPVAEPPPAANNTTAPPSEANYSKFKSYIWDQGLTPHKFCFVNNMTFWRTYYTEFWGSGCVTDKSSKQYNSTAAVFESRCAYLPCCYTAPSLEYSYYYGSFDCGYN